jgi:hypothetical protein
MRFGPEGLVVLRLTAQLLATGVQVHAAVAVAEVAAKVLLRPHLGIHACAADASGQRGRDELPVCALAPHAGHGTAEQAQHAHGQRGLALQFQAGVLTHQVGTVAHGEHGAGAGAGVDAVARRHAALGGECLPVAPHIAAEFHHAAGAGLRPGAMPPGQRGPGQRGLQQAAAQVGGQVG